MTHTLTIKVRGYHCDLYGHVNNARYLEMLEEARWDLIEDRVDLDAWSKRGRGLVIAGVNISYKRPAPMGMVLEIRSTAKELGRRFGVLRQVVHDQATGKVVAEADVTFAVVDLNTGRAVPLVGDVRAPFEPASGSGDAL